MHFKKVSFHLTKLKIPILRNHKACTLSGFFCEILAQLLILIRVSLVKLKLHDSYLQLNFLKNMFSIIHSQVKLVVFSTLILRVERALVLICLSSSTYITDTLTAT